MVGFIQRVGPVAQALPAALLGFTGMMVLDVALG